MEIQCSIATDDQMKMNGNIIIQTTINIYDTEMSLHNEKEDKCKITIITKLESYAVLYTEFYKQMNSSMLSTLYAYDAKCSTATDAVSKCDHTDISFIKCSLIELICENTSLINKLLNIRETNPQGIAIIHSISFELHIDFENIYVSISPTMALKLIKINSNFILNYELSAKNNKPAIKKTNIAELAIVPHASDSCSVNKSFPLQHLAIRYMGEYGNDQVDSQGSNALLSNITNTNSSRNNTNINFLKLYSYESRHNGCRRFLVMDENTFIKSYMNTAYKHLYEIIQSDSPTRIYFDMEYSIPLNAHIMEYWKNLSFNEHPVEHHAEMVHSLNPLLLIWIDLVIEKLKVMYNLMIEYKDFILLDSTTEVKYSQHCIVHIPYNTHNASAMKKRKLKADACPFVIHKHQKQKLYGGCGFDDEILFVNNRAVGQFVESIIFDITEPYNAQSILDSNDVDDSAGTLSKSVEDVNKEIDSHTTGSVVSHPHGNTLYDVKRVPKPQYALLWVNTSTHTPTHSVDGKDRGETDDIDSIGCFIDRCVYTRNRAFRLLFSSKFNKKVSLSILNMKSYVEFHRGMNTNRMGISNHSSILRINELLTNCRLGNTSRYALYRKYLFYTYVTPYIDSLETIAGDSFQMTTCGNRSTQTPNVTPLTPVVSKHIQVRYRDGRICMRYTAINKNAFESQNMTVKSPYDSKRDTGNNHTDGNARNSNQGGTNMNKATHTHMLCSSLNCLEQHGQENPKSALHRQFFANTNSKGDEGSSCMTSPYCRVDDTWSTSPFVQCIASHFPMLDAYVVSRCNQGGIQGVIKGWSISYSIQNHFPISCNKDPSCPSDTITSDSNPIPSYIDPSYQFKIKYQIHGNRYCYNIGRHHKSNHIGYEVNINHGYMVQYCWDSECNTGSYPNNQYRSPNIRIPEAYLPSEIGLISLMALSKEIEAKKPSNR